MKSDSAAPSRGEQESAGRKRSPSFWQRRYLLRHYRQFDDATLAAGSGLSTRYVADYLAFRGATRNAGDLKRIDGKGRVPPPEMMSPSSARRDLTKLESRPLTTGDALLIAAMAIASSVLYALTCARTVTGEDAGEFLAAVHTFGVPHPPGYPLWLLLCWTADHAVPWVSTAWRVAMVSALASAAANAVLLAVALKTVRSRLAAFTATALFAVSFTHWTQAVIPEVYGLNTLFVALQILLLVRLAETGAARHLIALAAVTGLSGANHTSAFPVGGVFAVGALLVAPQLFRSPRTVVAAVLAGLLPLALYGVLPLASMHHPYSDWGHPQSAGALWRHVTRAQYTELEVDSKAGSYSDYLRRLQIMADWAARQFGSGRVLLIAGLGTIVLLVRQTGLWLLCLLVGWLNSVGITRYTDFPFEREHIYAVQIFWIPAWIVLAWLMAGGLDILIAGARRLFGPRPGLAVSGVAFAALVAWPAIDHYPRADRSRTTLIESFGRSILDVMEPGALYFPSSDHSTFSVLYQQGVLGYRMDVVIADKTGELESSVLDETLTPDDRKTLGDAPKPLYREMAERLLIQRWKGPVYFANRRDMRDLKDRVLEPVGPIFKVMTPDEATAWWKSAEDGSLAPGLAVWQPLQPLLDVDERQQLDFTVQMVRGDLLYMKGFAQVRAKDVDGAIATWERVGGDLAPLKQEFNNIGSALAENGRPTEALGFYERAIAEDPHYDIGLRNKALVLGTLGRTEEMIAALRQALVAEPEQRDTRLELARKLAEANRPVEALIEYEALAMLDRDNPLPFKEGGKLMLDVGDKAKARTLLSHALDLSPRDSEVAQWLDLARQPDVASLDPALPKAGSAGASAWSPDELLKGLGPGGPKLPQLPRDPALGLGFDPMRGPGHIGSSGPRKPVAPRPVSPH